MPSLIDVLASQVNASVTEKCSVLTNNHESGSVPSQSPQISSVANEISTLASCEVNGLPPKGPLADYSDLDLFDEKPFSPVQLDVNTLDSSACPPSVSAPPPAANQSPAEPAPTPIHYSPASPRKEDCTPNLEFDPPVIPLTTPHRHTSSPTKSSNSSKYIVDSVIMQFNHKTRNQIMVDPAKAITSPPPAIASLIAKMHNAVKAYLGNIEWTSVQVDVCASKLLHLTQRPKFLAQVLIESIQGIRDEPICTEFTPPAPAMRPSDRRYLVLVLRLTKHIPVFDKYLQTELEMQIFKLKYPLATEALISLMHFYIALLDVDTNHQQKSSTIRLLMYKCLYYFKKLQPLFIYQILVNNPMALPSAQDTEHHADPLIRAFATILSKDLYNDTDPQLKKQYLFYLLKIRFGYFALTSFSYEQTIGYCIECINDKRLKNVDYALILLAKRRGWEWAIKSIIDTLLLPLLTKFMPNVAGGDHDHQIQTIVITMASILKTVPGEYNITNYLDLLASVLKASTRKLVQESAAAALCQLARFGYKDVYSRIAQWQPDYEVDGTVMAAIVTFVHKKPKSFWFEQ